MLIRENFKEQFKRFSMEGISKEVILNYFRLFKAIKKKYPNIFKELNHKLEDNFHMKANDYGNIDNYKKFKYLESVVDFLMGQVDVEEDEEVGNNNGNEKIFENKNILVLRGLDRNSCINIRKENGKNASWCVARTKGNMYYNYRNENSENTFYFVKNKKKPLEDKYHFFALQVDKHMRYIITSFLNDGDMKVTWDELIKIEPNLAPLKNLIVPVKLSQLEKYQMLIGDFVSDSMYQAFNFRTKKQYINSGKRLSNKMFEDTPITLIEEYLRMGKILGDENLKYLKSISPKLFDFYIKITNKRKEASPFLKEMLNHKDDLLYLAEDKNIEDIKVDGEDLQIKFFDLEKLDGEYYFNYWTWLSYNSLYYSDSSWNNGNDFSLEDFLTDEMLNDPETHEILGKISFFLLGDKTLIFKNAGKHSYYDNNIVNFLRKFKGTSDVFYDIEYSFQKFADESLQITAENYVNAALGSGVVLDRSNDILTIEGFKGIVFDIEMRKGECKSFDEIIEIALRKINPSDETPDYYSNFNYDAFKVEIKDILSGFLETLEEDFEETSYNGVSLEKIINDLNRDLKYWGFKDNHLETKRYSITVNFDFSDEDILKKIKEDDPAIRAFIHDKKTNKTKEGIVNMSLINNLLSHHELIEGLRKLKKILL